MAKLLISLLGTGKSAKGDTRQNNYETTDYLLENHLYENQSFVAAAILEHFGIERLYLVGTSASMWDNVAEHFGDEELALALFECKSDEGIKAQDLAPLEQLIDQRLASSGSRCHLIEDGESEAQLWGNFGHFMELFEQVREGDSLYLDVTHLFRSASMMAFIMMELARTYKELEIGGIFYGLLKKEEPSVIVDMRLFFELMEWARAIKALKSYGSPQPLLKMVPKIADEETTRAFRDFAEALMVSDVAAISGAIKRIKGKLELFDVIGHHLVDIVSSELRAFVGRFDGKSERLGLFQFELSRFYLETQNYPMFYLTLTEAIVSRTCEREGLGVESKEGREEAKGLLVHSKGGGLEKIGKLYKKINDIRKNIAHKTANETKYPRATPKDIVANASEYLEKVTFYFKG